MAFCGIFAKTPQVNWLAARGCRHQLDDMTRGRLAHLGAIVAEKLTAGQFATAVSAHQLTARGEQWQPHIEVTVAGKVLPADSPRQMARDSDEKALPRTGLTIAVGLNVDRGW